MQNHLDKPAAANWMRCPSTHCERAQECRSPNDCSGTGLSPQEKLRADHAAPRTPWQIVVDGFGYPSIHDSDEDGKPGDLIAHTFADHEHLICAAPSLYEALHLLAHDSRQIAGDPAREQALRALAKARGEA